MSYIFHRPGTRPDPYCKRFERVEDAIRSAHALDKAGIERKHTALIYDEVDLSTPVAQYPEINRYALVPRHGHFRHAATVEAVYGTQAEAYHAMMRRGKSRWMVIESRDGFVEGQEVPGDAIPGVYREVA